MMRPISLLCMLLAIGSGLYLYRVKYHAQLLDREINLTLRGADDARARAALVRADYALLNDPIRLQELTDQYLPLKTTQPTQFTTLADLERRLPPIGIAVPEPPPEPDIPAAIIRPEPRQPVPEPRVADALPRPPVAPAPRPAPVAAPTPAPAPPQVAPPQFATAPSPAPRSPTSLAPPPVSLVVQATTIPPATQLVARSTPLPAVITPPPGAPRAATPSAAPADSAPPPVRSALGMARRGATQPAMPPGGGGTN